MSIWLYFHYLNLYVTCQMAHVKNINIYIIFSIEFLAALRSSRSLVVGRSVGRLVGWSVGRLVGPSVRLPL